MKYPLLLPLLSALFIFKAAAVTPPPARENIEWCDVRITHTNENKLPRVLLLGDSITSNYFGPVEKRLADKAYVNRLATSAFLSDPVLLAQIAMVLDMARYDVIHFNNGMHGWQHSEEEYRNAFPAVLATIRQHAPNAKLIWASTTSLKIDTAAASASAPSEAGAADAGKLMLQADLRQVSDARIVARNAIAAAIMQRENIPVDDLHALTLGHPELHSDNVHFKSAGTDLQAEQVSNEILKQLPPR